MIDSPTMRRLDPKPLDIPAPSHTAAEKRWKIEEHQRRLMLKRERKEHQKI